MSDDLVTLGTFHNATEAQFAINRLKEAGVPAVMADDNLVAMDFLLGNAIGWIKVQVRGADLERAEAVLADLAEPVPEEEIPWDDVPEAEAEAEEDIEPVIEDDIEVPVVVDDDELLVDDAEVEIDAEAPAET